MKLSQTFMDEILGGARLKAYWNSLSVKVERKKRITKDQSILAKREKAELMQKKKELRRQYYARGK